MDVDQKAPQHIASFNLLMDYAWLGEQRVTYSELGVQDVVIDLVTGDTTDVWNSGLFSNSDIKQSEVANLTLFDRIDGTDDFLVTIFYAESPRRTDLGLIRNQRLSVLQTDAANGQYSRDGFITYTRATPPVLLRGELISRLYDADSGEWVGATVPVFQEQEISFMYNAVGDDGSVWLSNGGSDQRIIEPLVWIDPETSDVERFTPMEYYDGPDVSSDGTLVVYWKWNFAETGFDAFVYDIKAETDQLVQPSALAPNFIPGTHDIIFNRENNIYRRGLNDQIPPRLLVQTISSITDVSPDGLTMVFTRTIDGGTRLYLLDMVDQDEKLIETSTGSIRDPKFSPDGDWITYTEKTGDSPRIMVISRDGGEPQELTSDPGSRPHWDPNGGWIYFVNGPELRRVQVRTKPTLAIESRPVTVFEDWWIEGEYFDIAPDGRIVIPQGILRDHPDEKARLVENWGDELRRLAGISN